jgi:hypothetical protein
MFLKSRTPLDMPLLSLCNKRRLEIRQMNRPLFPATLSIPSYDIGKQIGLRTYQHPLVQGQDPQGIEEKLGVCIRRNITAL